MRRLCDLIDFNTLSYIRIVNQTPKYNVIPNHGCTQEVQSLPSPQKKKMFGKFLNIFEDHQISNGDWKRRFFSYHTQRRRNLDKSVFNVYRL